MRQNSYDDSPSLFLIPTPIGNLDDITYRALKVLETVDYLLCEDTRETKKLLNHFNLNKKVIACHEYNEEKIKDNIISLLRDGNNLGLVTDQGTPIISDPGFIIAKEVINAGYNVISLPGATAFVPALTMSGIEPSPFLFYGFLNSKSSKQKEELKNLVNFKYTLIFYEAPHRLKDTLSNMLEVLGDRRVALCRELSKIHEEVIRDNISNIIEVSSSLKGEFVIIVEGNKSVVDYSNISIDEHIKMYLEDGISEMDAIKRVAKERGVAKSIIYKEYHIGK